MVLRIDARDEPGAGAAGGLGFGLIAFCGARLRSGFELVADLLDLENEVAQADLIITGEGKVDAQTLHGKGPHGVAQLARKHGKPVLIFAGMAEDSELVQATFDRVEVIRPEGVSLEDSMKQAPQLLEAAAPAAVVVPSAGGRCVPVVAQMPASRKSCTSCRWLLLTAKWNAV